MYKIVIDSCGELTEEQKKSGLYCSVPLTLEINGEHIVDDDTFDQASFLQKVAASPTGPKSACPSPEAYMKAFEGEADHIYVVTLSANLSGSYNSAVLAKNLYEDEHGTEKKIHVFNSCSASIGQTIIGMKAAELDEAGYSFEEVVEMTESYRATMNTYFVLENLETLRKAGRLSGLKALVANTLNIKPVMGSTKIGTIQELCKARGMKKALSKMVEEAMAHVEHTEERVLIISHCNCPDRAESLKKLLEATATFKQIIILDTRGVSSMYANDGGIIMVV